MNYYTQPPQVINLPPFLYKRYAPSIYSALVEWADGEYQQALHRAISSGRAGTIRVLASDWSGMRVLSQMDGFRRLCAKLDEETWNKLDRKTRKFIRKAYELYELLRKS